jgi:hypothetical protein
MRRRRGGAGWAAVALGAVAALAACPAQQAGGPPPADPVESAPVAEQAVAMASPVAAPDPVEAGFTHCCGTAQYRMEIECGEMLKRCYENAGGQWKQTYGRFCKEALSEGCYLEECDAKCQ